MGNAFRRAPPTVVRVAGLSGIANTRIGDFLVPVRFSNRPAPSPSSEPWDPRKEGMMASQTCEVRAIAGSGSRGVCRVYVNPGVQTSRLRHMMTEMIEDEAGMAKGGVLLWVVGVPRGSNPSGEEGVEEAHTEQQAAELGELLRMANWTAWKVHVVIVESDADGAEKRRSEALQVLQDAEAAAQDRYAYQFSSISGAVIDMSDGQDAQRLRRVVSAQ